MGQRHSGHPLSNAATASAHAAERGWSRQAAHVSVAALSSSGGGDVGASSCAMSSNLATVAEFGDKLSPFPTTTVSSVVSA